VASRLKLWASYSEKDGGVMEDAVDVDKGEQIQKTLVILKPDNFKFPSARVGNIIDIFSASGLRIVCAKVHRMSVAEAEEFYGPVRAVLQKKLVGVAAERAAKVLGVEFGMEIPVAAKSVIGEALGPAVGDHQFYQIIQFMTGAWAPSVAESEKAQPGKERCLILVYSGVKAVDKIRKILGPTDPSKAEPGSVRKEFGKDIMINAAHASDSTDNAKREMRIVKVDQDLIKQFVDKYYK
jgi:nucleoside diphosphate kinase